MSARVRVATAVDLVQALILQDKLDPEHLAELGDIKKHIEEKLEGGRNMLVHGLWDEKEGEWRVLKIRQMRRDIQELKPDLTRTYLKIA